MESNSCGPIAGRLPKTFSASERGFGSDTTSSEAEDDNRRVSDWSYFHLDAFAVVRIKDHIAENYIYNLNILKAVVVRTRRSSSDVPLLSSSTLQEGSWGMDDVGRTRCCCTVHERKLYFSRIRLNRASNLIGLSKMNIV